MCLLRCISPLLADCCKSRKSNDAENLAKVDFLANSATATSAALKNFVRHPKMIFFNTIRVKAEVAFRRRLGSFWNPSQLWILQAIMPKSVIRDLPAAAWPRLSRPCTIAAKPRSLTEQDRWKLYGIGRLSRAPSLNVR